MVIDANDFDRWTRRLRSRRTVALTLVGLSVGPGGTRQAIAAPTPAKKGKRPRFGCTKQDNACPGTMQALGPDAPAGSGGACVNDNKGRPFCAASGHCMPCKTYRDCVGNGPSASCIRQCPLCEQLGGGKTGCFVPLPR